MKIPFSCAHLALVFVHVSQITKSVNGIDADTDRRHSQPQSSSLLCMSDFFKLADSVKHGLWGRE